MNPLPTWKRRIAIALLVAAHLVLGLVAASRQSVTVDEIFHLTGGYCFNALNDYRVHPDNGVLPQRLHALPAVLAGARPPTLAGNDYWRDADSYVLSYQFFYESGNDHWPILMAARAMNALFSVGILLLVFQWARSLAGEVAGFTALALGAFCPTLLAHGPIATTDVAAAFFLTASAGAFWAQLQRGGRVRLLVSAAVFALACVTKYSAVLLIPIFGGLALAHLSTTPRAEWRLGRLLGSAALHGLAAWLVIWACFGFRYSASAPGLPPAEHLATTWGWLLEKAGWQGTVLRWIGGHRLLPEAFLWGYTHTYIGSLVRSAYLLGEFSNTGWRLFFPLAFLWKSTPAELGGLGAGLAIAALHWRRIPAWSLRLAPLLALTLVYGAVAITSKLNIGHRHLLPLYPALFIGIGVWIARWSACRRRFGALLFGTAALAQVASTAGIFPHFLAYFNSLAGGPDQAWRLLVDSSLDWGQDLRGLKTWLDRHNSGPSAAPVFLSYFGSGEPSYYGLSAHRLPFVNGFKLSSPYVRLEAGIYCVSVTTLVQVYSAVRGPWTPELEKEFQQLKGIEPLFAEYAASPERRKELERDAPAAQWRRSWARHDLLRFARLCHYLRLRPVDGHVGHSILIHRLTAEEISAVTAGTIKEWRAALEQAAGRAATARR